VILAIDPGDRVSAYALIDEPDCWPSLIGEATNNELRRRLRDDVWNPQRIVCEMIESYGMPVGREIFETVLWTGRFVEAAAPREVELIGRRHVKLHLCESARAKDPNIIQALVDRFAPGERNRGKGTKAAPGWFHGFHDDIWQAYALAVYAADTAATDHRLDRRPA
jgi:hypothetical protein